MRFQQTRLNSARLHLWLQVAAGWQHRRRGGGRRLHEHAVLAGTQPFQGLQTLNAMLCTCSAPTARLCFACI